MLFRGYKAFLETKFFRANAWVAEATLSELAEALNEQCSVGNYRLQIH
jgi:hypothetical protein